MVVYANNAQKSSWAWFSFWPIIIMSGCRQFSNNFSCFFILKEKYYTVNHLFPVLKNWPAKGTNISACCIFTMNNFQMNTYNVDYKVLYIGSTCSILSTYNSVPKQVSLVPPQSLCCFIITSSRCRQIPSGHIYTSMLTYIITTVCINNFTTLFTQNYTRQKWSDLRCTSKAYKWKSLRLTKLSRMH